jgi:transposase
VEKCLVPTLSPGDIVVMDNLPSHYKGARVEQLITPAGAELRYAPAYSPDMNPIEKAFSKLKAYLRKFAERTVTGLIRSAEITSPPAVMTQLDRESALSSARTWRCRCGGLRCWSRRWSGPGEACRAYDRGRTRSVDVDGNIAHESPHFAGLEKA